PTVYQGIRTNVDWGAPFGLITPRKKTDIIAVTGPSIYATPNPGEINGIIPGLCGSVNIDIYNEGVGNLPVTALYLDDATGTDEFELISPPGVPFNIGTWDHVTVEVQFCPLDQGDEATTLLVEYGVGHVLSIPINGTTAQINDMDWCDNFNTWTQGEWVGNGWTADPFPSNSSVYPTAYQGWTATPDGTEALFLRNRYVVGGVRVPISVTTPGIRVTGSDPVITWKEISHSAFNGTGTNASPRNLYVSTDGINWTLVDSYLTNTMPDRAVNPTDKFRTRTYSLAPYIGQTIWWKFQLISHNNEYIYWVIDDVCVQERINSPIIKSTPYDFAGVQVGESATHTFKITNVGISVLKVKSVSLVGDGFTITDNNTYPVEVHDGTYAYAVNGTDALQVDVTFTPDDIGDYSGKLVVVYGLYSDHVYEIPFTGVGLSCYTAQEAQIGENHFFQNSWWKYTAEKFQIVNINSCHPNNTIDPYDYSYDTYLYVYADCEGTLLAENDDLEWDACPYNRASSGVELAMNEGETVYIFWPLAFPGSAHALDEMIFNIEPSYPIDGDVCETAIPLTLPVVNHFGTTVGFNDDYDASPCSPYSNYMDGNDKVYTITVDDGYLTGNILGAYGSIHVLDKCPKVELEKHNCKAFVGGPNGGEFRKRIQAGTYYVIISTWAPPQTVDYLLNMSWEEGSGVDDNSLMTNLSVFPNPTNGEFTVSISNAEISDLTLELVNISGQVVYRNEVKGVYSYTDKIDASEFAKGVYYLKVNNGEEVKVEKVVVQ
ncbi:MAG: T9SS type A sorting domain-containing protein, partial [Bacteroidales bacterium]|nr:T9SS type A sorting domain-containing protein [Bacteroidales bacterium]